MRATTPEHVDGVLHRGTRTRRRYPDVETSSDDYARRFAGPAGRYFLDVQARALERLMPDLPSASVLDVGGGHGQLVETFLGLGCHLTILGSEDITHARVRARHPGAPIEFVTGDLLDPCFADRSFEVVVAVRLVAHIDDWQDLLSGFCRVARHSVIIDYPSWRSVNTLTPLLFRLKKGIEKNTRQYRLFRPSRIAREFRYHDFNVSESYGQFLLPMFVHRAAAGARWLQVAEKGFQGIGLTAWFGSPVLLRADRN